MEAYYDAAAAAKEEELEYCRAFLYHSQIVTDKSTSMDSIEEMPCVSHTQLIEAYKAYQLKMGLSFGRHVFTVRRITCDFCMECDDCVFECKEALRHYEWPMAAQHWKNHHAETYVPFNPLAGPCDVDVNVLTWKAWQVYKDTWNIHYDFTPVMQ